MYAILTQPLQTIYKFEFWSHGVMQALQQRQLPQWMHHVYDANGSIKQVFRSTQWERKSCGEKSFNTVFGNAILLNTIQMCTYSCTSTMYCNVVNATVSFLIITCKQLSLWPKFRFVLKRFSAILYACSFKVLTLVVKMDKLKWAFKAQTGFYDYNSSSTCMRHSLGVSQYIDISQYTRNLYRIAIRNVYRKILRLFPFLFKLILFHSSPIL